MSKLVTIAESDLYFNKLKDHPELIKHYIEAKSINEYINKSQEAQELVTLYMNILRSVYDLISKMREIIISNNAAGVVTNKTVIRNTLIAYSEELDHSILSMTYKGSQLLSGYKIKTLTANNEIKNNVSKVGDDKLDMVSFEWEGLVTKKVGDLVTIEWSKKYLIDENKWTINYKTGTIIIDKVNSIINCHENFDILVDVDGVELLDTITVDTFLEYHFIVGDKQQTTTLFFPRIGTGIYKINKTDIFSDEGNGYRIIDNNLVAALTKVNQFISLAGSEVNVISMKVVNLKNKFNGLMGILNNYRENI